MALRILITGATSGLGRETARQLAQEGAKLALTGRRQEKLRTAVEAAKNAGAAEVLELLGDTSKREDVARHYKIIKEKWGGLDWAILNAGVPGEPITALHFSADNVRSTVETNLFGVAEWMQQVLPDMIAAKSGTVAAVSSLGAFRGSPEGGPYVASKAALIVLLESARIELRSTGIKIVTICPAFFKSEMLDLMDVGKMPFILDTEDAARRTIKGIREGRRMVTFPAPWSFLSLYVNRFMPGFLYDWLLSGVSSFKKPPIEESKK